MKNKKISTISFILAGLATSKFCLIWTIVIDGFLKLFSPDVHSSGNLIEYNGYLWIVMNQSSIWFATSLSIFYFLKISTFSHRIFLWLKGRLNMVLFLLLGCLLISWLVTFPHFVEIVNNKRKIKTQSAQWICIKVNSLENKFGSILVSFSFLYYAWLHVSCCSLLFGDTTAAAKSLQLCPTLCDPIDGSPTGSPVPGILQARTLEWVETQQEDAIECHRIQRPQYRSTYQSNESLGVFYHPLYLEFCRYCHTNIKCDSAWKQTAFYFWYDNHSPLSLWSLAYPNSRK